MINKLIRKKTPPVAAAAAGEKKSNGRPPAQNLSLFNRVLWVIAAGMAGFILIRYLGVQPQDSLTPAPAEVRTPEKPPEVSLSRTAGVKPFEDYQQRLQTRDLFQAPWEKSAPGAGERESSAAQINRQLKLVGILLDQNPQAIIEDAESRQTFFVSAGERVGEARVEEIRADRVILIFHEERVELTP